MPRAEQPRSRFTRDSTAESPTERSCRSQRRRKRGFGETAAYRAPRIHGVNEIIHAVNDRVEENGGAQRLKLSIVVPAFNEEAYLGATLDSLRIAAEALRSRTGAEVETIVVDNNSRDRTASIARERGATMVHEPVQVIARARNAGARRASGDVLVFVDADVIVPPEFLIRIHETMGDPACIGGGVETTWQARRLSVRLYLGVWWLLVRLTGMVLGAAQFARRDAFEAVGGYDERTWIGEDVDFVWRLGRLGTEDRPADPADREPARPAFHAPLRQVAAMEDPDLDQPALHRGVSAVEGGMERLVLAGGPVTATTRFTRIGSTVCCEKRSRQQTLLQRGVPRLLRGVPANRSR